MPKILDVLEEELLTSDQRHKHNDPLCERTRHGICLSCNSRFTWTGAIPEVPDCSCGRKHTEEDFKKFEMVILGKDKDESSIVGNQRHLERQSERRAKKKGQ